MIQTEFENEIEDENKLKMQDDDFQDGVDQLDAWLSIVHRFLGYRYSIILLIFNNHLFFIYLFIYFLFY